MSISYGGEVKTPPRTSAPPPLRTETQTESTPDASAAENRPWTVVPMIASWVGRKTVTNGAAVSPGGGGTGLVVSSPQPGAKKSDAGTNAASQRNRSMSPPLDSGAIQLSIGHGRRRHKPVGAPDALTVAKRRA